MTLDDDYEEQNWNDFDFNKYMQKIKELAVIELEKLLKQLPAALEIEYIDGSAFVDSPQLL